MVLFNYSTKELTAKVVYYGPGLCGKTTNLQWIHEKLPIRNKGKMLSLATEADRTLFFDFLPIELGSIRGMKTRIQLYTVPGQVFYNATRRMVLKGADCVVFVADSQEAMIEADLDSLANLRENLEVNEINAAEIPMVLQYNKRDLPNALPVEILNERLNPRGVPFFEAVARQGIGVEETLKGATTLVFSALAYGQAPSLIVDKRLGFFEALRQSASITRGHRANIFVAGLLGMLVFIAGGFACGIGMVVSGPLFYVILAVLYVRLTGQDPNGMSTTYGQNNGAYATYPSGPGYQAPVGGAAPPAGGYGSPY